jgi:hypothetical protein
MGETARELVRSRHDPAAAARAMVEACEELSRVEPPHGRQVAVPQPSSLTWRRIDGDLEVHGHEAPWEEGERRRLAIDLTNRGPARWLPSGPGSVSLDIELLDAAGHRLVGVSSVGLPAEVASGDSVELTVDVRRPPGPTLLRIESRVGDGSMKRIGGMRWESAI